MFIFQNTAKGQTAWVLGHPEMGRSLRLMIAMSANHNQAPPQATPPQGQGQTGGQLGRPGSHRE